jgi:hypothetical protein
VVQEAACAGGRGVRGPERAAARRPFLRASGVRPLCGCRPCLRREVLMHGSELQRLGRRGAGPGEFARAGRMESGGRLERGPHPWCKAGPWVRVRRWPKRVACTMRAHGAGGGGRCARSVKNWFGRIESKCEDRRVLLPGEGGEGCSRDGWETGEKGMKYLWRGSETQPNETKHG